jgi:hypothetical protein
VALSAEERLITVRVKIKRARKHLAELEEASEKYRDSYTHVGLSEETSRFSQAEPNLRKLPIIHFDMLAIAGDVLQNLRSALDHVMYHLALVANPRATDAVLQKVCFPIGKNLEGYKSLRNAKIKRFIESRAVQFIDSLKPYRGGNYKLWKLHETNNIDKHRKLISVGNDILCEGEGFDGHYLLRDRNPPFTRMNSSKRTKDESGRSGALVPTLGELTSYVANLVEEFKVFLDKP